MGSDNGMGVSRVFIENYLVHQARAVLSMKNKARAIEIAIRLGSVRFENETSKETHLQSLSIILPLH
jgi:hypothetical protein